MITDSTSCLTGWQSWTNGFSSERSGKITNKITWCQLLIGATGSGILSSLDEDATWEDAKEVLLTRLGIGSVRDEAWAALKTIKKESKDIVELAGQAENSPRDSTPETKKTPNVTLWTPS